MAHGLVPTYPEGRTFRASQGALQGLNGAQMWGQQQQQQQQRPPRQQFQARSESLPAMLTRSGCNLSLTVKGKVLGILDAVVSDGALTT